MFSGRWKEAKEMENVNLYLTSVPLRVRLLKSSPRKALSSVTNLLASPSKSESKRNQDHIPPPVTVSPSKFRHKLFAEVNLFLLSNVQWCVQQPIDFPVHAAECMLTLGRKVITVGSS